MTNLKVVFFFLYTITALSQPITEDIKHFFHTGKNIVTSPVEWETNDWLNLGGTLFLTGAAYALDNKSEDIALRNRSSFNDALFQADQIISPAGIALAGGIYIYGLADDNKKIRHLGLQLGEAAAYSGIIDITLKVLIGRSRPFVGKGHKDLNPFQISDSQTSFPSGHTTFAFALSTVMANYYDNTIWKISWYTAAGIVGAARIYHDKHWLSDVIFGAALGHFVAEYVVNGSEEKNKIVLGVLPGGFFMSVAL